MSILKNRAGMSTATTGTGTITLGAALTGYQSFAAAGVADGDVVSYLIEDGNNWEIGRGTYASAGTTLARTTILESSNSDNAIDLSGSASVYVTALAEDVPYISTVAYASRPAASKDGNLFLPSDGFVIQRDTGAAWVPWGPLFPFTEPDLEAFAWINQETATATKTKGGIYMVAPVQSGDDLRILKKSAPATPYTITAAFLTLSFAINYIGFGLCFRQSSDGKLATLARAYDSTGYKYQIIKYNSATSYSATYGSILTGYITLLFLRIADNGTNRISSISVDGQNWHGIHTIGRTDFLTADEVGFFVNSNNASYPSQATLLSWKEA